MPRDDEDDEDEATDEMMMLNSKNTGVRLHYVEAGREDAPLLVFVHGFPEFWFVLKSFIKPYRRLPGQEPRHISC